MAERTAEQLLGDIAEAARDALDDLVAVLYQEIVTEIPELALDAPLRDALLRTVQENLASALAVFATPSTSPPPAPQASLDHARRIAQRGQPLSSLLRAYRLGQAAFQQYMIGEIAKASENSAIVAQAAQQLSGVAFSYIDRISGEVVQAFQNERDYWQRQRIATRAAQVDALLAGTSDAQVGLEQALGYVLDQLHVAVVLWVEHDDPGQGQLPALERAAASLAQAAHCASAPLVVPRDVTTVWAWLPSPATPVRASVPPGLRAAIGTERLGLAGFRDTHDEALATQRVVGAADASRRRPLTRVEDVGALTLLCHDLDRLKGWVAATLGPLATNDAGLEAVRETVEVFLRTGGSYVQTGQALTLHRNSVQYRVKKAADLMGRPVEDRRLDLLLALLACRVLGEPVLSHG